MLRIMPMLALSVVLTGCVTSYSLTEAELENYVNQNIKQETKSSLGSIKAKVTLNDVDINIGKGEFADRVAITTNSQFALDTAIMPLNAQVAFTFSATPWYNPENHSVYLRNIALSDVQSTPNALATLIKPFEKQTSQLIQLVLEKQPIYKLDTTDWKQDLLSKFGKEIEIKPGEIAFILAP